MAPKAKSSKKGGDDGEPDRVHVVVRIRPPVRKYEKFGEGSESLQYDKEKNMLFLLAKDDPGSDKVANPKQFVFDRVLWKDSGQHDAWEAAGLNVTKSVMQGYTGCVIWADWRGKDLYSGERQARAGRRHDPVVQLHLHRRTGRARTEV